MTAAASLAQHLVFAVDGVEYGLPIAQVEEIRPAQAATTPLPNQPRWVRGVINLRGVIVPIYDLRARFDLPRLDDERRAVTIVVGVAGKTVGLLVDAVADVVDLDADAVQDQASLGPDVASPLLRGLAHAGERVLLLLDLGELVGPRPDDDLRPARGRA